ncbi:hypothetical protein Glove_161g55 [Diversispora epigaea]|uniref:Uncharacterized protein n=1 Tax=Diversispora epigaea TaxID=1348612 RepID=A0A397J0Z1_9GLOM|nr:hypothetical protein Glove_161g55 [Diversispora epigaea]
MSNIKFNTSPEQKKEQGLIQEISISIKDQNNITEISQNNVPQNYVTEIVSDQDIIYLYQNACDTEKNAIKANQEEILCWCFYTKKFKSIVKDFMANGKVRVKKSKGQVCNFIIQQLPNTKRENLFIDHFAKMPDIEFTDDQDNSSDDLDDLDDLSETEVGEKTTGN